MRSGSQDGARPEDREGAVADDAEGRRADGRAGGLPPPSARRRILDAALDLFGRQGYAATSVRAIAEAAQVSPALVLHHFGSKAGLQEACDDEVIGVVAVAKQDWMTGSAMDELIAMATNRSEFQPLVRYLLVSLREDTAAARHLFDRLVEETEQFMAAGVDGGVVRPSAYPRLQALLLVSYSLGPLMLASHLGRHLGTDGYDVQAQQMTSLPSLEIFTQGVFADPSLYLEMRNSLPDPESQLPPRPRRPDSDVPAATPTIQPATPDPATFDPATPDPAPPEENP